MEDYLKENNIDYTIDASFKDLTSYKVGGTIKYLVSPTLGDIEGLIKYLKDNDIDYFILGSGTNFLPSSKYYDGVVIKLDKINAFQIIDDTVTIGAGLNFSKVALKLASYNYKYYAELSTIPGSMGGMLVMNAGAYGASLSDIIIDALVYKDGEVKTLKKEEMLLDYRSSIFKDSDYIILSARFKLIKSEENESEKQKEFRMKRSASQPLDKPNAGSVFKNPIGFYAGKLIEDAGLKGYSIGGAKVSERHANFIVNYNNASSEEIFQLIMYVKVEVQKKFGIDLELEIKTFNF